MVPLRDDNPTRRRAYVTLALIAINVFVYAAIQPHGATEAIIKLRPPVTFRAGDAKVTENVFAYWQAAVPCEVTTNRPLDDTEIADALRNRSANCSRSNRGQSEPFHDKQPYLSVLVSMFLHGGWLHLIGNMLFLWIFGNNIEDRFGRIRYLVFYLAAGLVAAAAHIASAPSSLVPVVGASGAIAGVMGTYLVLYPRVKVQSVLAFLPFVPFRVPAWLLLGFWFVSQFWVNPNSGVAWVAHVGGFVFGCVIGLIVRRSARIPEPRYR